MISIVMSLMTRLQHRLSEPEVVSHLGTAEVRYVRVPDTQVPPGLRWNPDWAAPDARAFSTGGGMSSGDMGDRWLRLRDASGTRYYEQEDYRSSS